MKPYTDIEVEIEDPVALIRLNRPDKLNAFTYHTLAELRDAVDAAVADTRVVGIVITGNGRGFCSGLDAQVLAEVTQREPSEEASGEASGEESPDETSDELPGLFSYLIETPKPVIAALNGVAAGGGLVLALMCDIRIASHDASLITVFLKRGLISELGTSWMLPRLVGTGRALDLLWMSDKIGAEEAAAIGLVDKLAEPERLIDTAREYIERLAVTSSPAAIAETKRLVYRHAGSDLLTALREAQVATNRFLAAPDSTEGVNALLEKRAPKFARLGEE